MNLRMFILSLFHYSYYSRHLNYAYQIIVFPGNSKNNESLKIQGF